MDRLNRGNMEERLSDDEIMERIMKARAELARRGEMSSGGSAGGGGIVRRMDPTASSATKVLGVDYFDKVIEPSDEFFRRKGLMGLVNMGNTCFMNTIIQCINTNRDLVKFMITNEYKEHLNEGKTDSQIAREWNKLTRILYYRNSQHRPIEFLHSIQKLAKERGYNEFTGFRQSDSTEFLQFFLESMHNALSSEVTMKIKGVPRSELDRWAVSALDSWKKFFQNDFSPIISMYYGQLFSMVTTVDDPEYRSISFDPFSMINLEIPPKVEHPNIYDCFDAFTHQEALVEYKQDKDDIKKYKKQVRFWKTPDHLVISFKRFNTRGQKINQLINFPIEGLDMTRYCINYEGKNTTYDLYAVANHIGGMGGGHYYAFCKNFDGIWYKFNDDEIRVWYNPEEPIVERSIITPAAYCLFYRRRS